MNAGERSGVADLCAALMAGCLLFSVLVHGAYLSHDAVMYLQIGERVLAGDAVYEDVFELNPPLVMWLNAVPAFVASGLGVSGELVLSLGTALAVVGAGLLTAWWLVPLVGRGSAAAGLWAWCTVHGLYLAEWAQREQLFSAAYLAYIASRSRPGLPLGARLGIGLLLGATACLKPHFVLLVGFVELCLVLATRRFRALACAELLAATAFGGAYAAALLAMSSEASAYLWDELVPMIGAGYEVFAGDPMEEPLRNLLLFGLPPLLLAWAWRVPESPRRELALRLAAWSVGGLLVYLQQRQFWSYHQLPAAVATALAGMLWFDGRASGWLPAQSRSIAAGCWIAFSLGTAAFLLLLAPMSEWRAPGRELRELVRPDDVVQLYAPAVGPYHALAAAGLRQTRSYMWDYPVELRPGGAVSEHYVRSLRRDFARAPDVVLIMDLCHTCQETPRMRAVLEELGVPLRRRYARVAKIPVFEVWRRRDVERRRIDRPGADAGL